MTKKNETSENIAQCAIQNVTPRLSSYQKLKQENERLCNEIYTLVREAETKKGIILQMRYNIYYDQIDAMMFGSRTTEKTTLGGIMAMITPNEG